MKRLLAFSTVVLALGGAPAWAACEYDGTYYQAGTQICFDGWLQECTVADYWSAVGMCKASDPLRLHVETERPDAEALMARALGIDRVPNPRQSLIR